METEYTYWEIEYISCEGNKRFTIARTPIDWDEYMVRDSVIVGGCGDDISEVVYILETIETDFGLDFCEI